MYDISDVGHLDLNVLDIVARVSGVGERPLVDQHTGRLQPLPRTGTAGAVIDVQLDTGLVHVMWIEGRQIKVITSRDRLKSAPDLNRGVKTLIFGVRFVVFG